MNRNNNKNMGQIIRLSSLGTVLGGTIVALGFGLNTPLQPRPAIASYQFPESIPLDGWQPISNAPIPDSTYTKLVPLASQIYEYQAEGIPLKIEMRYVTATKGDVTQFIQRYTEIPENTEMKVHQEENQGSYVVFTHQNRLYLSSCLHPQGESTATGTEYLLTKVVSGISPNQFIGWLTGKDTIFDQRCLWSHFSLPLESSADLEDTHQTLKETWQNWHNWWSQNFPN